MRVKPNNARRRSARGVPNAINYKSTESQVPPPFTVLPARQLDGQSHPKSQGANPPPTCEEAFSNAIGGRVAAQPLDAPQLSHAHACSHRATNGGREAPLLLRSPYPRRLRDVPCGIAPRRVWALRDDVLCPVCVGRVVVVVPRRRRRPASSPPSRPFVVTRRPWRRPSRLAVVRRGWRWSVVVSCLRLAGRASWRCRQSPAPRGWCRRGRAAVRAPPRTGASTR